MLNKLELVACALRELGDVSAAELAAFVERDRARGDGVIRISRS